MQALIYMLNYGDLLLIGINVTITRLLGLLSADSHTKKIKHAYPQTPQNALPLVGERTKCLLAAAMRNSWMNIPAFKELVMHGH